MHNNYHKYVFGWWAPRQQREACIKALKHANAREQLASSGRAKRPHESKSYYDILGKTEDTSSGCVSVGVSETSNSYSGMEDTLTDRNKNDFQGFSSEVNWPEVSELVSVLKRLLIVIEEDIEDCLHNESGFGYMTRSSAASEQNWGWESRGRTRWSF
jgi:hypothetical protein